MLASQILENNKPEKIGKYQVTSVLGKGAMGVVYKGYDPFIKRTVAIKTIHPSLVDSGLGEELLIRFSTEAEAVGRLVHPNIVSIFDFDEFNGAPYFVMEYVEGQELKEVLQQSQKLSLTESIAIVQAVLDALAYTHQLGIVHRDIKPANIFVLRDGSVKIADFGIAHLEDSDYTQAGKVLGTPSYMSPEQCQGMLIDHRSDLFSVCLILFEMLTGKKAFKGTCAQETMRKVVNDECLIPEELRLSLPKGLEAFFEKALAKLPEDRFQSATELKSALARWADGVNEEVGVEDSQPTTWRRKSIGAVVLISLLLLFLTFQVFQSGSHREDEQPGVGPGEGLELTQGVAQKPSKEPIKALTTAEKAKVERLLQVAKAHLLVQRLVAPQGSNAYDAFQLVLKIDPSNRDALIGLDLVEDRLIDRVVALQNEGKVMELNSVLELGKKLFPISERWQDLGVE